MLLPGGGPVSEDALPPLGAGFRLRADVEVGAKASGIICALGDWSNGWALYVLDGRPTLVLNLLGDVFRFPASEPLAPGRHSIAVEYKTPRGARTIGLAVDGALAVEAPFKRHLPIRWQIGGAGLLVGHDRGFPVCEDYEPPFAFSGTIERIVMECPALAPPDAIQQTAAALHRE